MCAFVLFGQLSTWFLHGVGLLKAKGGRRGFWGKGWYIYLGRHHEVIGMVMESIGDDDDGD